MAKIVLINLPFASVRRPSIGLTQLRSRLNKCFPRDQVSTTVLYLNMDFASYMGLDVYNEIAETTAHHSTGLGDWLFRQAAFPELPANTEEYFRRCYPRPSSRTLRIRETVIERQQGLESVLEEFIDHYEIDQADIVGFSSTFAQNVACFAMARLLKQRRKVPLVVMGGPNCEAVMGQEIARNMPVVDFVFSGPALVSLPRWVGHYLAGEYEEMHRIPGVFSRKNVTSSPLPVVGQLPVSPIGEDLDINAQIDLDYTDYLTKLKSSYPDCSIHPSLLFETSRGCWWGEKAHCTFCGLNGQTMRYRSMSSENALGMLQSLFRHADICRHFESVDNIMPRHYVDEVFTRIAAPDNTDIFYEVKADLTENDLAVLSRAGVRRIQPGIESLATSTLKLMRKGTTATQNIQFLRNCLVHGVWPYWNLLVGFPGEGPEVYRKYCSDLPLITHLIPPSGAFPVRFDRFSPYFKDAVRYNLDLHPVAYYGLTYPFDDRILSNLAYYFADHNYDADYFIAMAEGIGRVQENIRKWQELWTKDMVARSLQPKLQFVADTGDEIFDSRFGANKYHEVGTYGRQLLESLSKPKTASILAREFSEPRLHEELQALRDKFLVFQEDERLVSLVCPPSLCGAPR